MTLFKNYTITGQIVDINLTTNVWDELLAPPATNLQAEFLPAKLINCLFSVRMSEYFIGILTYVENKPKEDGAKFKQITDF